MSHVSVGAKPAVSPTREPGPISLAVEVTDVAHTFSFLPQISEPKAAADEEFTGDENLTTKQAYISHTY